MKNNSVAVKEDGSYICKAFFTSELLYIAVVNNEESKGVMPGGFVAVDIYKTIEMNISLFTSMLPVDNGKPARNVNGIFFGIYVRLEYFHLNLQINSLRGGYV